MPSQAYWLEKPWIMSADYEGRVTVQDFERVMSACLEALEDQPVYFLVDLSKASTFPFALSKIPSMRKLVSHPNTVGFGWVGANRIAKTLINGMVSTPMEFFSRREDALEYLRQRAAAEQTERQGETISEASDSS